MISGITSYIPIGIFFKKFYCRHCGEKLKRKKVITVLTPRDARYEEVYRDIYPSNHLTLGVRNDIKIKEYILYCESCDKEFNYDEQKEYAKAQKRRK